MTPECKAETLTLSYWFASHTSDAKLTWMVIARSINLVCLVVTALLLQKTRSPPGLRLLQRIGDMHPRNHNVTGKEIDIRFSYFEIEELYIKN